MNLLVIFFSTLIFIFPLPSSSTSCSIFPSLNCSCFQSNTDLKSSLPRKKYSHLYCQGNSLTEKTFQSPFGSDFEHRNQFRTVSIEFSVDNRLEIHSNQFDSLAMLFSKTSSNASIEISLRFNGFSHIKFHERSLTSTIFQEKHPNRRLRLYLIPTRNNLTEMEQNDQTVDQFDFSGNCFAGLFVSQLTVSIHTFGDLFPSVYSFERIFNNTNISELHLHGSLIRPALFPSSEIFQGSIASLTVHRHVDSIDSTTFPYYSHVSSYTIHSMEAHSLNLRSFLFSHTNFHSLEILQPRFDVSIDQLIPTLTSLTLDVEHLTEKTLFAARHLHKLKLGSRLRTITPNTFGIFSKRFNHFDLSEIDLSQLSSDSRCYLMKYLSEKSQSSMKIIYPRVKNLTDCDCARLFLQDLQSRKTTDLTCARLCQLNDCPTIREHFQTKDHIGQEETNHIHNYLPSIEVFSDPVDVDMMTFLINQTSDKERNETQRRITTTTTTSINIETNNNLSIFVDLQEYDDLISLTTPELFQITSDQWDDLVSPNTNDSFSWVSFFVGVACVFLLLIILSLSLFFIIRYRKQHNFKPVPVYV